MRICQSSFRCDIFISTWKFHILELHENKFWISWLYGMLNTLAWKHLLAWMQVKILVELLVVNITQCWRMCFTPNCPISLKSALLRHLQLRIQLTLSIFPGRTVLRTRYFFLLFQDLFRNCNTLSTAETDRGTKLSFS